MQVPDLVRQRAMAHGVEGRAWLEELPHIIGHLTDQWGLVVGTPFEGGTAAYVAEASRGGRSCVLKIAMPLDGDADDLFARSVMVHDLAAGRGCAQLLASDASVSALLLERLGPNLDELGYPVPRILEVVATTLRTFWQPAAPECPLPTGIDQAAWLADFITRTWQELGRPCSRRVVDRAVSYCDERASAFDAESGMVIHGDAHGWNTLRAGADGYKFVDPEGLVSEPAHDLGIPMREYNEPLLAGDTPRLVHERAEFLGGMCDADPEAVWQWGFIERVSTGLANVRDFEGDDGLAFLEVAERCL